MAKLGNVFHLNSKGENRNPYATILTFLTRKGQDSENTKDTYKRHIRDFFRTMKNKELETLVESDLVFTKNQIKTYQVALKEQYKGSTVNNAISALKECYDQLEDDGFDVNASWFNLERYDEHDSESWDAFTHDEVIEIINLVSKTRAGRQKALLVRLAYATAFRKQSLLDLKFTDIIDINGIWYIKTLGKGNKWSHKKLTDELYQELMDFKGEAEREKIFTLTTKTVNKMMNFIREKIDLGDRRIVFHSFKKASIEEVNVITGGDLKAMQAHGDHSDPTTTVNNYLANKKLEDLVAVDVDAHVPVEEFEKLTRDDLLELLMNADRNTQIKLLRKMGKM
ncbi:tyrosine-type recombinase/integrase [Bacillus phage vB_BanS_Chewbecca]|uniref:Integrase n=1 Tax=Bacillus phage vB_BanS_Chewbecca TaxID=2894786 RepID=A0AAE8YPB4_9CAUD|nr:tyrosine-type recombinase/integrase [Bacillus phage vB_BanS_Chewbecca]UGO46302.1 tyrosine-type recombinase/integrase [Bacillus phage vB_BanS_Chewbecca]